MKNKSAAVIGGGIERRKETISTIINFLRKTDIPCVIDADAIYAVAENKKVVSNKNAVITPHAYEFYILTGIKTEKMNLKEKEDIVRKTAWKLKTVILLKGNIDIISNGMKTAINMTGSHYMTVGGTGDVLAGIVGSAYINGRAGEICAREKKQGMTASDLVEVIPKIII